MGMWHYEMSDLIKKNAIQVLVPLKSRRALLLTVMGLRRGPINFFWMPFPHCTEFKVFGGAILFIIQD